MALKRAGVALKRAGVALERAGVALKHAGVALKHTGVALKHTGVALQRTGVALQHTGVALQRTGVVGGHSKIPPSGQLKISLREQRQGGSPLTAWCSGARVAPREEGRSQLRSPFLLRLSSFS